MPDPDGDPAYEGGGFTADVESIRRAFSGDAALAGLPPPALVKEATKYLAQKYQLTRRVPAEVQLCRLAQLPLM